MREFDYLRFKWHVAALRFEVAALRHWQLLRKAGFRPDQPREDDGKWAAEGEEEENDGSVTPESESYNENDTLSDETLELSASRKPSGHHYVPQSLSKNMNVSSEAKEVFDQAKTGRLLDVRSNKYDYDHRVYSEAVGGLFSNFVSERGISPEKMTTSEAKAFVDKVLASTDPRIENFNKAMHMREIAVRVMRRIYRASE